MEEIKVVVYHVALAHGQILVRDDISDLILEAEERAKEKELDWEQVKVPPEFGIAVDRLIDNQQGRALTLAVDRETGVAGWSFCHERDQFSRKAGLLIALNRLADSMGAKGKRKRVWFTNLDTGEKSLLLDADGLRDPDIRQTLREKYGLKLKTNKGGKS